LPVGESLAHGKVCLCAATGGIPDAAGAAGDYIDPYNARDGLRQLTRYLDDPALLHAREREVVDQFRPRSWRDVSGDLARSMLTLAGDVQPVEGVAVMRLPPERYLPITGDGASQPYDGIDGALSAELVCVSGWHPAEFAGSRASAQTAVIQFRANAPVGAAIVIVLRLAAQGRNFKLALRAGSGNAIAADVAVGAERVAVLSCTVEARHLVTVHVTSDALGAREGRRASGPHWSLKGILYFEPKRLSGVAMQQMLRGETVGAPAARRAGRVADSRRERILLAAPASMDNRRRAASVRDFRSSTNIWWPSEGTTRRDAPLMADDADKRVFADACADGTQVSLASHDAIRVIRRSDVHVSMARFSEGSIFDRAGTWRALGYLQGMPRDRAAWLTHDAGRLYLDPTALAAAPFIDASCLVFYNGNLHNYYHWLVEGLLCLDVLAQTMGPDADVRIVLPQSMDIAAVFDHRRTLDDVGLGGPHVVEVADDLVRVREALWVDSDQVQMMPAQHIRDFQRRIAARRRGERGPRRRLLVARRGPARMIANQAQVEALLAPLGFETVYLEGMGMAEQIRLFQDADYIIGPHGAGLSNLLFCEPGTRVIEFMPAAEFRPFFWLISRKLDLVHGVQVCPTTKGTAFQGAVEVDIGKLRALVDIVGR
jgi:hypothetical protein